MAEVLTTLPALAAILPALAANGSPVLLRGRGTPIDGGRRMPDGRPVLGPGKTWEGLALGTLNGAALAALFSALLGDPRILPAGTIAAIGALLGDMAAAFIKRRIGLPRGAPAPILDQLDFYSGALAALALAGYLVPLPLAAALALVIPLLHRATNMAAYRLGLKNVPW